MAPPMPPKLPQQAFALPRGDDVDNVDESITTFANLATEFFLMIIPRIAYHPKNILNLRLTNHRLNNILNEHKNVLVPSILELHFKPGKLRLFPDLPLQTYSGLRHLHSRLSVLENVRPTWVRNPDLEESEEGPFKAGLLLLYRLQDATTSPSVSASASTAEKIALLQSFPATSLACLHIAVYNSLEMLQMWGPVMFREPFNGRSCCDYDDVGREFQELLLIHGPEFLFAMIREGTSAAYVPPLPIVPEQQQDHQQSSVYVGNARATLETEVARSQVQQHENEAGRYECTRACRRTFRARVSCTHDAEEDEINQLLQRSEFDDLGENEEKMARVVAGESLLG